MAKKEKFVLNYDYAVDAYMGKRCRSEATSPIMNYYYTTYLTIVSLKYFEDKTSKHYIY